MVSRLIYVVVSSVPKVSAANCVDGPAAPNASLTLLKTNVKDSMAHDQMSILINCKKSKLDKYSRTKRIVYLDGTLPLGTYYHTLGDGDGVDNWLIFMEGGGWWSTDNDSKSRTTYALSSTNNSLPSMSFGHILSQNAKGNPDFCNWNRIYVCYCDGSSFTSGVQATDPYTNVTYRGVMIFHAIIEDLLAKGMINAKNCFFPQYIVQTVETPLFIVMSSFDQIHISYNLFPEHDSCLLNKNCTLDESAMIEGLRLDLLGLLPIGNPSSFRCMWITTCITHEVMVYSCRLKVMEIGYSHKCVRIGTIIDLSLK